MPPLAPVADVLLSLEIDIRVTFSRQQGAAPQRRHMLQWQTPTCSL